MNKKNKKKIFMRSNGDTIVFHKRLNFDYEVLEEIEAGIVLCGTEVKSLRINNPNFNDAYAFITNKDNKNINAKKNEILIKNFFIPILEFGNIKNQIQNTERKLLLHKNEILRIKNKLDKGLTLVPSAIYFNKRGFVKVKLALVKGKKLFDKRRDLKEKDLARETSKDLKKAFLN